MMSWKIVLIRCMRSICKVGRCNIVISTNSGKLKNWADAWMGESESLRRQRH